MALFFFSKISKESVPNINKVIGFLLSIPGSNVIVERVFSIMNSKWIDVRNRCQPDLIKAELQIRQNFSLNCKEFYQLAKRDEKLLRAAKSEDKYRKD